MEERGKVEEERENMVVLRARRLRDGLGSCRVMCLGFGAGSVNLEYCR